MSLQLRKNVVAGVLTTGAGSIVSLVSVPLCLKYLGYDVYGVWLTLAAVMNVAQVANLGLGPALMKLVAEEWARTDRRGVREYITASIWMLTASGCVAVVLLLVARDVILRLLSLDGEARAISEPLLPWVAGMTAYSFLVRNISSALCGLGRMDLAQYVRLLIRVGVLPVLAVLLAFGHGVYAVAWVAIGELALEQVACWFCVRRLLGGPILLWCWPCGRRTKLLLEMGSNVVTGSVLNMLLLPFNKGVVARFAGAQAVPIYDIGFTVCMQLRSLLDGGLRATMPAFSALAPLAGRKQRTAARRIVRRALLVAGLGAGLLGLVALYAEWLLSSWLGGNYNAGLAPVLRVLLLGTMGSLLCLPMYYFLMGSGHVRQCTISQAIQAGTNAATIAVLIKCLGEVTVYAVAWTTAAGMLLSSAYVNAVGWRRICRAN